MKIGSREFETKNNTYIVGILNVTPDSFSDGGRWNSIDAALRHTEKMIADGADIIDIGGESTRPGYTMISDEEETDRIIPVIKAIKRSFDIPISIDTYKSVVAREGLEAGADMINDIWGLRYDSRMSDIISEYDVPCCLMHNKKKPEYNSFFDDLISETNESLSIAAEAGISLDKIIIDPGIGFGKTFEMNITVMKRLDEFCKLGYPVLIGCSRKSVIGEVLELSPDERLEGTIVTTVKAVLSGCSFVRVHDVKENYRAVKMTKSIF